MEVAALVRKPRLTTTMAHVKTQEIARNVWVCQLAEPAEPADILKPIFWTHCAGHFRANDRLEVMSHDGAWYAEMIVRAVTPLDATMGLLKLTTFDAPAAIEADEYEIKWKGPAAKWRITRVADGAKVRDGFDSEELAKAWLALPPELRAAAA